MVAPIDAKATVEAEGETFTLRLNFRTMALCEAAGVDPFNPDDLTNTQTANMVKSFAAIDHPDMSGDVALALVLRHSKAVIAALAELYLGAAGKSAATENPPKAGRTKKTV